MNDDMNKRLRHIRKTLGLKQADFGARLGVSNVAISGIESGYRNLTDQMFLAVCREFRVREEWLRHGTGEMFIPAPVDELDALAQRYGLPDIAKRLVKGFVELDENAMQSVLAYLDSIMSEMRTDKPRDVVARVDFRAMTESQARAAVDEFYRAKGPEKKPPEKEGVKTFEEEYAEICERHGREPAPPETAMGLTKDEYVRQGVSRLEEEWEGAKRGSALPATEKRRWSPGEKVSSASTCTTQQCG